LPNRLRLLLTAVVVSAAAVALAVWINGPAGIVSEAGSEAAPSTPSVPGDAAEFSSPVKNGVFPSAVTSEDMRKALENRDAEAAAARAAPPNSAGGAADYESPREIGEFLDPDAPLPASTTAAPREIGEFLDPEAAVFEGGADERIAIGRFLDPDQAVSATGGTERPVSIGRPIDPDGVAMQPPAAAPDAIEIGEYIEVATP